MSNSLKLFKPNDAQPVQPPPQPITTPSVASISPRNPSKIKPIFSKRLIYTNEVVIKDLYRHQRKDHRRIASGLTINLDTWGSVEENNLMQGLARSLKRLKFCGEVDVTSYKSTEEVVQNLTNILKHSLSSHRQCCITLLEFWKSRTENWKVWKIWKSYGQKTIFPESSF